MKGLSLAFLIFGIGLLLLAAFSFSHAITTDETTNTDITFLIGAAIFAILFLFISYLLHKEGRKNKRQDLDDAFLNDY